MCILNSIYHICMHIYNTSHHILNSSLPPSPGYAAIPGKRPDLESCQTQAFCRHDRVEHFHPFKVLEPLQDASLA